MSIISRIMGGILFSQMVVAAPVWSVETGEPIPDFGVQTFAGNNISRASLAGRPTMIVFWNTWCPTCLRELPQVGKLAEKFSPQGLSVVAINTGLGDNEKKARAYCKKSGYLFPAGFDRRFDIGGIFGIRGVPTVLLVDAKGIVRYKNSALPDNMDQRFRELTGKDN